MAERITAGAVFTALLEIGRSSGDPRDYEGMRKLAESQIDRLKAGWSDRRGDLEKQIAGLRTKLMDAMQSERPSQSERVIFQHALHYLGGETK